MLIDIIAGARPNFMKVSTIIRALKHQQDNGGQLRYRLVHTGQHYDSRLSGTFFEQLGIPLPDVNLEVGSGTQAEQTAAIMVRYEKLLMEKPSRLCLVVGDVTSTMACAIAAQKLQIPVAHVEAGIRSGDWSMPEEINRMVTDSITNWYFTTSEYANTNLRNAGVDDSRIFFVGNTMIDTLLLNLDRLQQPAFWNEFGLESGSYLVMTLHRPSNVDDPKKLGEIFSAIIDNCRGLPVIFPVHPRTAKTIESAEISLSAHQFHLIDPQPYLEFNYLVNHARAVITDSGGVTEETTVMGIPCITMRDSTERPETVLQGTNELIGSDPSKLAKALNTLFHGKWKKGTTPPLWDGRTGERIVRSLEALHSSKVII
jgi:UDP-N-acetylglucosamine 2-epimerase (non-hydrolysing)